MPTSQKKETVLLDAVKHFDEMPDSAFVRLPVVATIFAIGPATVWRWSESGRLPAPKKIGPRVSCWNIGELRAALKKL